MPDTESSTSNEPAPSEPRSSETRNLPAVIPQPSESARALNDGWVSRMLRTLFNWKAGSIRADLEVVLEAGAPGETGFSPEESTMLKNILGLRERRVEDVMLPRADIIAVQRDISLGDLVRVFEGAGHSRLVVYNDTLDDPVGMVHIRDLIAFMTTKAAVDPVLNAKRKKPLPAGLDLKAIDLSMPLSDTQIMRELLFVPPSMPAIDLLAKMQATRIHLALVIDEYGGTDGLISMEDIVELIVGDIADEHDLEEAPYIVRQPDGSYVADARTELEEVTATVGTEFDVGEAADDVDTLGGYLVMKAGRVPVRGELVPGPDTFEIEILDADPRRVKRVRIYRSKDRKSVRSRDARRRPADGDSPLAPAETTSTADAAVDRERPISDPAAPSEIASPKADPQP